MKAREMLDKLALVAYHLSLAEGHERKAASCRATAMRMQGEAHSQFKEALIEAVKKRITDHEP